MKRTQVWFAKRRAEDSAALPANGGRARCPQRAALIVLLSILFLAATAQAHIGSPTVVFEGNAGPYLMRVIVRPPEVVPGLAEISVRILKGTVQRVTVLPVYFRAGRKGAPPPDRAAPVNGDANLYSSQLWLMESGAYSVDVSVEGKEGQGTVVVPVNSVAMTRRPMKPWFGAMLSVLGAMLFISAVKLAGAAFGESIVEPGAALARRHRWYSRFAAVGGVILFSSLLFLGKRWWDKDDRDYRNNRLYKRTPIAAEVHFEKDQPILRLDIADDRNWKPLIPDHGKMMHLFMVREPSLDAFAHLHPIQKESRSFASAIPPLPEGSYQIYADITHENGFSETLTANVQIPRLPESYVAFWKVADSGEVVCASPALLKNATNFVFAPDMDDSWHIASGESQRSTATNYLAGGYKLVWDKQPELPQNRELSLQFKLLDPNGQPAALEAYMGMLGHSAVRRNDGSVFAHLHPSGTFSMASLQFFEGSLMGAAPIAPTYSSSHTNHVVLSTNGMASFPYEFPKPGPYRIWVQLKSAGKVFTGSFEADVQPKG